MAGIQVGFASFNKPTGVTLTSTAAARVKHFMADSDQYIGLRLGVKQMGCSGLGYEVSFVEQLGENDQVFEDQGIKVVIENKNLAFLDGIEIDYGSEGINESFKFNNPNASGTCGCGESFSVK